MRSIPYKKHRGEGGKLPTQQAPDLLAAETHLTGDFGSTVPASQPCSYVNKRGQSCQTPSVDDSALCAHHARRMRQKEAAANETAATELLAGINDFSSADAVNLFLGNLVKQVVRKRVARPDAVALAYLSQLLLNSLSATGREDQRERDAKNDRPPTIIFDGALASGFCAPDYKREDSAHT